MFHDNDDPTTIEIVKELSNKVQIQTVAACAGIAATTLSNIVRFGAMPCYAVTRNRVVKCAELNAHARSRPELRFVE